MEIQVLREEVQCDHGCLNNNTVNNILDLAEVSWVRGQEDVRLQVFFLFPRDS